jgi:hypothetical protein
MLRISLASVLFLVFSAPVPAAPAREPDDAAPREIEAPTKLINKFLAKAWRDNNLQSSPRSDDQEFLRRATLDILGHIATPEEIREFDRDSRADKRLRAIERLLAHSDHARYSADLWTDLLLPSSSHPTHREQLHTWLRDHAARNTSYKEVFLRLLGAEGKTSENAAATYIVAHTGAPIAQNDWGVDGQYTFVPLTANATRVFLGVNASCTQCHDHPFALELKQRHFWGLNAFLRQIEVVAPPNKRADLLREGRVYEVRDNPAFNKIPGVLYEKRNGVVMKAVPQFVDGTRLAANENRTRRAVLADLMVKHPNFAKVIVNRTWAQLLGHGLLQTAAVDDFGDHNAPVHPELLEQLAADFVAGEYDRKKLIRWICASDAYQLQSVPNKTNASSDTAPYFSRRILKRLTPRQRIESILVAIRADATLTADQRAQLMRQWQKTLFSLDAMKDRTCEMGDHPGPFMSEFEMLRFMLSSQEVQDALAHKDASPVARAMTRKGQGQVLEELYLAALNRYPTAREAASVQAAIDKERQKSGETDLGRLWQDLFWALLNSSEFVTNH